MPDSFGDIFGGGFPYSSPPKERKIEKGLPWEAKVIEGKYYVPFEQVALLLKQNNVLPKVRQGIENRIAMLEIQKDLDI